MAEELVAKAVKARYIMVGGFLGAGKTTAIVRFAKYLTEQGMRVGLITNDQSNDLVDTQRVRAAGYPVEEITGGCFCCKFDSLVEASRTLTRRAAPDVLLAEPVGSCTDLKATVAYPLRQLYGDDYAVAPLSVLVDPNRCARVMGLVKTGQEFSTKVVYVYRKQLEEAEILVINKIDTVDADLRSRLSAALTQQFPHARVLQVSCTTGEGLAAWFEAMMSGRLSSGQAMEVDYDQYADGEALLGWLNARVAFNAPAEFDGNDFVFRLAENLQNGFAEQGVEVAHLKMTLAPDEGPDLAAISLTRTAGRPVATHSLTAPIQRGDLVINLRAEADPALLEAAVKSALGSESNADMQLQILSAFRPGRPTPTHRIARPQV